MFWNRRNRKYVDGSKDNLPKRLGDYSFGLSMAMAIAVFAEYVLKENTSISDEKFAICMGFAFFVFVFGILMYKKGGL